MDEDKTKITIDNHSMKVQVEGVEGAEELMELASSEMERMERERLRGELQNIEDYPQPTFLSLE
jgi:hypothetical protein